VIGVVTSAGGGGGEGGGDSGAYYYLRIVKVMYFDDAAFSVRAHFSPWIPLRASDLDRRGDPVWFSYGAARDRCKLGPPVSVLGVGGLASSRFGGEEAIAPDFDHDDLRQTTDALQGGADGDPGDVCGAQNK
jgi:hypothetical protein